VSDGSKKQKSAAKKKHTPSKAEVMGLVSSNRQGVSRQVRRLQGRLGPGKSKATVKDKRIKSAVGEWLNQRVQRHKVFLCTVQKNERIYLCRGWSGPYKYSLVILLLWSLFMLFLCSGN
jgi:hypothetical protein